MSSRVLYGARGGAEAIGEVRASSPASGQRPPARLACIAFTERGLAVARRVELARSCPSPADAGPAWEVSVERGFGEGKIDLAAFADCAWAGSDALLFVGAAGIAVRAIAPHVRSKATDPAVVVLDEGARFSVALLSGHIGGANELARQVARAVGAEPVVTTATDGRGLWAVDEWAARSGLLIANPHAIKAVSGRMLSGCEVSLFSDTPISGKPPRHVAITPYADEICAAQRGEEERTAHRPPQGGVLKGHLRACRHSRPQRTVPHTLLTCHTRPRHRVHAELSGGRSLCRR